MNCQVTLRPYSMHRWQAEALVKTVWHKGRPRLTKKAAIRSVRRAVRKNPRQTVFVTVDI